MSIIRVNKNGNYTCILCSYLVIINVAVFSVYGIDNRCRKNRRASENGGSIMDDRKELTDKREAVDKNGLTEKEAIELYRKKNYPKPALTADIAVFAKQDNTLRLLMIRRGGHPFLGCWALPGGFADKGETIEQTAARELEEETGIKGLSLSLVGVYSAPGRDPRGWTVSAAYTVLLPDGVIQAIAGDDAEDTAWVEIRLRNEEEEILLPDKGKPAFDHEQIIGDAVRCLQKKNLIREAFRKDNPEKQKPDYVLFWNDDEENGVFSNWYHSPFVVDDFIYQHVEQYMMAQKAKVFHDSATYTEILKTNDPWKCKKLGRNVTPFDSERWDAVRYEIVKSGNRAKFEQNPELKEALLKTENRILAEASPKDTIWGIGLDREAAIQTDPQRWPGQNLMGKILTELREEFRNGKTV